MIEQIGEVAKIVLPIVALIVSGITWLTTMRLTHYSTIDRVFFDLLKIRIERPHVLKRDGAEYDVYAFMIWNFIETVHDCTAARGRNWKTWEPVVLAEAKEHWAWFEKEENRARFKDRFRRFAPQLVKRPISAQAW